MSMILVSACLLGLPCRYDAAKKPCGAVQDLLSYETLIPFCPECMGGLSTPRPPAELQGGSVINANGEDVTAQYRSGAEQALLLCQTLGIRKAILKSRSPSCGKGEIYDGTFSKTLIKGNGIAADLLLQNGIEVLTEEEL